MSGTNVPCPHDDGGLCTIPDQTLYFRGDEMVIRSRDAIERSHPNLDLSLDDAQLVDLPLAHDDLLLFAAPGDGDQDDVEPEGGMVTLTPAGVKSELRRLFALSDATEAVIVLCTCEHTYIKDL